MYVLCRAVCCVQTKCGYQFLQEEQAKYGSRGFTVLAFPCNQFGGQEPGGPQDIREYTFKTTTRARTAGRQQLLSSLLPAASHSSLRAVLSSLSAARRVCRVVSFAVTTYHTEFPLLEKTDVNGPNTHPVFSYLKQVYPGDVTWNFHGLFVINEQGIPIRRFHKEPYPDIDAFIGQALDDRDKAAQQPTSELR